MFFGSALTNFGVGPFLDAFTQTGAAARPAPDRAGTGSADG